MVTRFRGRRRNVIFSVRRRNVFLLLGTVQMKDFYIKHMVEAHERGDYSERDNYAKTAGIDVIDYFFSVPKPDPTPPPA